MSDTISILRDGRMKQTTRGMAVQTPLKEADRIKSEQGGMVAKFQISFDGCLWEVTDFGKTFDSAGKSWRYIYVERA